MIDDCDRTALCRFATWLPHDKRAAETNVSAVGETLGQAFVAPFAFWVRTPRGLLLHFLAAGAIGAARRRADDKMGGFRSSCAAAG
jgi:hypothetical protein